MELQTIRQKLQTLKAAPPEALAAPWGQSRSAPSPHLAQVTTAIETLRQRSRPTQSPSTTSPALHPAHSSLQQFDAALATIDHLAQQQQQALYRLKALGDSLTQQIQPGTSPDVDDIAHFLDQCQTLQIPTVQRDGAGYLSLSHHTVNFHQAEHDATSNAEKLRVRSQLFQHTTSPQETIVGLDQSPYEGQDSGGFLADLSHFYQLASRAIQRWIEHYIPLMPRRARSSHFTLLDGSIWCIGAAIARILLNQLFQFYPALWTPVAFMLIASIIFSLYRALFRARPNPVLGYRTLMIIVGLLLGGRFS
mgnify:CR=1 FL=1